jgi:hypothetical protein
MTEMPSPADRLARRTARFAERRADWTVFGFDTAQDPKFARIQRRYPGASGSIPATALTISIQAVPVGNMIPMHCHETEEVTDLQLGKWNLVQLPIGPQHELFNTGEVDRQVQTLLSTPQPRRPQYNDPELLALQVQVG